MQHFGEQRAGKDQHIDQQEQAGEQQHRTKLVRCDMRVETVGGHDALLLCRSVRSVRTSRVGTASTSVRLAPRSKNSLRVKPNMPANKAAGICWMPVLYSWTALLKKRRLAAILFSRSDSSLGKLLEVGVGLEVRIGLRQRDQPPERAGELVFGGGDLRRSLRRHRRIARLDDVVERAALVAGVALHGLDQVRDQIVALLELHVDVGKGLTDALAERDQAVIRAEAQTAR